MRAGLLLNNLANSYKFRTRPECHSGLLASEVPKP